MNDAAREADVMARVEAFRRRSPRLREDVITSAHGAGGKASAALTSALFLEAFTNDKLAALEDGAVLVIPPGHRVVVTTDSFVVRPRRFPGGSIGHLAVHGTVNDLAAMGAIPRWLTAAFVLEEGFAVEELRGVVADMAEASVSSGVHVVAGDTKVVDRGAADGVFITTTGIGLVPETSRLGAQFVRAGDKVIVSGPIGDHGIAVLVARGDLALEAEVISDTAPLHNLVATLLAAAPETRWMRDATRGGVATVCNELARATELAVYLDEASIPVRPVVHGACELLGLDPLYVANEGRLVALVAADEVDAAMEALRSHPLGTGAAVIGTVADDPPATVVLTTSFGGSRIVDMLVGDPLPRIC